MLVAKQVHFAYSKHKDLFSGLQFSLEEGKICGLLGKNGAGKSSLLRLITGAQFSKSGQITFKEQDVTKRSVSNLQDVYFFQEEFDLPKKTVKGYLNDYSVFYPKFDHDVFHKILERFEVNMDEKLKSLSFGQQKKFHLAFAMATRVKLLIMDEPTNGLDIPSKAVFRKVVSENLAEDQSIIISTHQIRDLGQLLDRILMIEKGKIILDKDLYELSEKFACEFYPGNHLPENSLYSEPVAGGNMVLTPTKEGKIGEIDIEILFNAIISNPSLTTQF